MSAHPESPAAHMRPDLLRDVLAALKGYEFREERGFLRQGRCPNCNKRSLWTPADHPWVLRCDRLNRCGEELHVKELFPDLFENWSERFKPTEREPNAAADAYLHHARGLTLAGLRGAYAQEHFVSRDRKDTTATVRFPIVTWGAEKVEQVSWWERLIDRPWRFGDMKARFQPGAQYGGWWWAHPALTPAELAMREEIWIVEGIFDSVALFDADVAAVAALSSGNYPANALRNLREAVADRRLQNPTFSGPRLIFALDSDKAGQAGIRKMVERAREEGWPDVGAAQIAQDGKKKVDWNDLGQREHLKPKDLEEYRWRGALLLAPTPTEKALLLYRREERPTFPFEFRSETWWATVEPAKLAETYEAMVAENNAATGGGAAQALTEGEIRDLALKRVLKVSRIANCAPRALYFQKDPLTDESWYFYRIALPTGDAAKATFTPSQIAKAASFKERLLGVSPLANFTGNTAQLDRLHDQQRQKLRVVEAVGFVGYSREHRAYVFNDLAVKDGKQVALNDDDYFELGAISVKSVDRSVGLTITPWEQPNWEWLDDLWIAFGAKGYVALVFWFGSFFAEQLRDTFKSYPFLELAGLADKGKTTLVEFLWKLCGREGYEGFDPSKSTFSALARNMAQVANLPVVLMEGDRDEGTSNSRKFDYNELKSAYNGRSIRSRGVRTSGNETYEPPFRGAIVLEQNHPTQTQDDAIPTRLVHVYFDGAGYNDQTKRAAQRLEGATTEQVSGFLTWCVRRETEILAKVAERFPAEEEALLAHPAVAHRRIAKCHGQLLALLEALSAIAPIKDDRKADTRAQIGRMAADRKLSIAADHPVVEEFWEAYDWLGSALGAPRDYVGDENPLNHSRQHDKTIAVNLNDVAAAAAKHRIPLPELPDLKRHLKSSKVRRYVDARAVNSADPDAGTRWCWVFDKPASATTAQRRA